jgi:acetyl esterase/lipase
MMRFTLFHPSPRARVPRTSPSPSEREGGVPGKAHALLRTGLVRNLFWLCVKHDMPLRPERPLPFPKGRGKCEGHERGGRGELGVSFLALVLLLLSLNPVSAQLTPPVAAAVPTPIPLWAEGKVPGALGTKPQDVPTITPYMPSVTAAAPRPAMVICPGGGYGGLADHEGRNYALYLNTQGIACFVLKYRLGSAGYRHPIMLWDVSRAVRTVRARAGEWNVDPNRVGIMGSSAGGHLASTILTHFDAGKPDDPDPIERQSSRPSLGVLCYAVISMQSDLTHAGSRHNLLGDTPSPELVESLSNERQVTAQTPPCFVWHTGEDKVVKPENSLLFAMALQKNQVPYDLHIYRKGGHGIGLTDTPPFAHVHPWAIDLVYWLKAQGWIV